MPRSDYDAPAGIPREMLQDTLIDVMAENDRLRARITELEAREEAEAKKIWQQAQRIGELEAAIDKALNYPVGIFPGEGVDLRPLRRILRDALERKPADPGIHPFENNYPKEWTLT